MAQRLKFPLNPAAVAAANQALWEANPELGGRQLDNNPEDGPYRVQWVKAYIAGGGEVEKSAPPKPVGDPIQGCEQSPPFDCAKAWKDAEDEADSILNKSDDPIQRNKNINAAYAKTYQEDKRLHWMGAAAFASKQVGCGLQEAKKVMDLGDQQIEMMKYGADPDAFTLIKAGYAHTVYDALATGNRNVFKDVYPAHRFYQKNGIDKLRECAKTRQPPVDKKVLDGLADTDAGRSEEGAMKILQHEQQDILQTRDVFGNDEIRTIMGRNQWWSGNTVGRFLGAKKTSVSYTPNCQGDPEVTFQGQNLADPAERWPYSQEVVNKFENLLQDPSGSVKLGQDLETIRCRAQ